MAEAHNPWNTTPLPLWASDFFTGTLELTDAQRGCYIQLLCYQWFNGSIPSDPQVAAKSAATSTKLCRFIVPKYFEIKGDRAINLRLEEAREEIESRRRKLSKRGRLAAKARWSEESETDASGNAQALPDAMQDAMHEQCPPSPTPSPTPTEQQTALSLGQSAEATGAGGEEATNGKTGTVWKAYLAARDAYHQETAGRTFGAPRFTDQRRKLIQRRLKDYPLDEVVEAVEGIFLSPHNRGQNDRGEEFLGLEVALRVNQERNNLERFRDLRRNGGPKTGARAATTAAPKPGSTHHLGGTEELTRWAEEVDREAAEMRQKGGLKP